MQDKRKGKLGQTLQVINIVPLLIFGFASILVCYYYFTKTMQGEIAQELYYVACSVDTLLDTAYPGNYTLVGEDSYQLYKGDTDITRSYELIDSLKENTRLEITIFYEDTSILTTIYNPSDSKRYIGIGAPDTVVKSVLKNGETLFAPVAIINNSRYSTYYMPLRNTDGSVIGMICVAKPNDQADRAVLKSLYPFMIAVFIAIVIISIFLILYTRRLAHVLLHIRNFLSEVASGSLTTELDPSVLKRADEFGDIGRSAISMQRSLRTMIEQDPLTGLSNRRAADRRLKQIVQKYTAQGTPFCIAIGDIDFFKTVNDNYGHDAGDVILKNVSDQLRMCMRSYGFAARWGGEEFLLVFDHSDILEAHRVLKNLMDDIRNMESSYEDELIKVTMTIGLVAGDTTNIDMLITRADDKLYKGKRSGRNRIVWDAPEDAEPDEMEADNAANEVFDPVLFDLGLFDLEPSDEIMPDDFRPDELRSGEALPDEPRPDEPLPDDFMPDESGSDEPQPDESRSGAE